MANQSPFPALEDFVRNFPGPLALPPWAVEESHRRILLLLNHVLMQEPVAMERLARHRGQVILAQWREFSFQVRATPAGLLDVAGADMQADLTLTVPEASPLALAQALLRGEKPPVRIAGDVQLAAEVNWLVDHVRWDLEEDLSRILGDAPAHALAQVVGAALQTLKDFVRRNAPANPPGAAQ